MLELKVRSLSQDDASMAHAISETQIGHKFSSNDSWNGTRRLLAAWVDGILGFKKNCILGHRHLAFIC